MKFLIRKTSGYDDIKPHKKAYQDKYTRIDERVVDSPEKLKYFNAVEDWYGSCANHRVENGHILRDCEECMAWFIDINTLEELINLQREIDCELVIGDYYNNHDITFIEIYDSYRE